MARAACAHVAHSCTSPHPGPEHRLRLVPGATAPGGLRGPPPTSPPKWLVDDDACSKRLAPAERWSLLWRHRHALWRPRRLASGREGGAEVLIRGGSVDQKGAQPQATEVVSSVKPQACEVIEGAGWGI